MVFRVLMWVIMIFGGLVAGKILDNMLFPQLKNNLWLSDISHIIGVFLIILVVRISKNTGRTLAKYGRKGKLKRMETNVLVKEGPYRYMRHPMHLGLIFMPLAVAFMSSLYSFILIIAPLEMLLMLVLIKTFEEPEAIRKFGDEYRQYMKEVPAFCFKPVCLKELLKHVEKT